MDLFFNACAQLGTDEELSLLKNILSNNTIKIKQK